MLVNPLQPENAPGPILVTLDGISSDVILSQPSNARLSIVVTDSGIMTLSLIPASKRMPSFVHNIPLTDW